jgi:hypothetical protein
MAFTAEEIDYLDSRAEFEARRSAGQGARAAYAYFAESQPEQLDCALRAMTTIPPWILFVLGVGRVCYAFVKFRAPLLAAYP